MLKCASNAVVLPSFTQYSAVGCNLVSIYAAILAKWFFFWFFVHTGKSLWIFYVLCFFGMEMSFLLFIVTENIWIFFFLFSFLPFLWYFQQYQNLLLIFIISCITWQIITTFFENPCQSSILMLFIHDQNHLLCSINSISNLYFFQEKSKHTFLE